MVVIDQAGLNYIGVKEGAERKLRLVWMGIFEIDESGFVSRPFVVQNLYN